MASPVKLPFSGARLREVRERAGLTQGDVSRQCAEAGRPIDQSQLSRLESDEARPSAPTLKVLIQVLGVDVDALLTKVAS